MRLKVSTGTASIGIGVLGAGVQIVAPDAKWFGWLLIIAGVLMFFFDVHVEGARVLVGRAQQSFETRLRSGFARVRANWLTALLILVAIGISPFVAATYLTPRAATTVADAPSRKNQPKPAAAHPRPAVSPPPTTPDVTPAPATAAPSPPRVVYVPVPAPKQATPSPPIASTPAPAPAPPPIDAPAKPAPAPLAVALPPGPTAQEVAAARQHREAGDDLFQLLFAAEKTADVNAALVKVAAWDRRGTDLVVDVYGNEGRARYLVKGYSEAYKPFAPNMFGWGNDRVRAYFARQDGLNLIRFRQAALSQLFVTAKSATN